jgi:glutamyl-tRNA reductase
LEQLGKFYLEQNAFTERAQDLPKQLQVSEIMMVSTCNRLMFVLVSEKMIDFEFKASFFSALYPSLSSSDLVWLNHTAQLFGGDEASKHLLKVASSLDSLVIGEREIITQVRTSFEHAAKSGLTADFVRLLVKKSVECAKDVFTRSKIANNPVSIVSLAYRKLRNLKLKEDARFLVIGAGVTNQNFAKYLKKHGFANFSVFNRTLEKAELLAKELNGKAFPLSELAQYSNGFDVIITCTGSSEPIVNEEMYRQLLQNETSKKIIIDLAVPADIAAEVVQNNPVHYIDINYLKAIAAENMQQRQSEVKVAEDIVIEHFDELTELIRLRKVELAMGFVPQRVKEIRETATNNVFAKDLMKLDADSRAVLEKMLDYMEKKYISVPMKLAKEIIIEQTA